MVQQRCPYYAEHKSGSVTGGMPLRPNRQDVPALPLPFCQHKHSPAPRNVVLATLAGASLLTCGGDVRRCQVPVGRRLDVR